MSGPEPAADALLRQIPSVDELLNRQNLRALEVRVGHRLVVEVTRKVLDVRRENILRGDLADVSADRLEAEILKEAEAAAEFSLQPVINATGVILHTNLGRAPLAQEALAHLVRAAAGYSNLEYDLERGERGKRDAHTDGLFRRLLGAERALVVNNNAAAVFLALNTLGEGSEVIVSRGELIEIGGSFRIPDVCVKSGAVLREVGTTNRTRAGDYAAAINERTRVLLRVHPSNFRIVGFTERPSLDELVELAHEHKLILMEDLGSGCLVDLTSCGVRDELPAGLSLKAGADVVTFSGDKLLGGPQAGILVGKREPLERIRKNPLFRALRVDKLTIAALEATASLYLQDRLDSIPALRMMRLSKEAIGVRAARLAGRISTVPGFTAVLRDGESVIGGGSTPGQVLPTSLVAVRHTQHSAAKLEEMLRRQKPAILGRVDQDEFIIDLRTVAEDQEELIAQAFEQIQ
ncbi:MAG: L-seryl-tRNA(Sec) selenium transferase [Terriglobia bacterium]|jgi:L-seryl-tRNA(Ser) seleniumtransferase